MTVVPLPDKSAVRCQLTYANADGSEAGSRFFLTYTGASPSAANCATLATDIATAWNTNLAPLVANTWTLTEVDVLDIATDMGASGTATVSHQGGMSGGATPSQVAVNIEFDIAIRYRGGKPRMFLPGPDDSAVANSAHWEGSYITSVNSGISAFFTAVEGASVGSMGTLQHVNISYYKGFHNVTNSSGRTRAAPTYRATALTIPVTGYSTKGVFGSQRRRRTATTP